MTKTLFIPLLQAAVPQPQEVSALLDAANIPFEKIGEVNWEKDFPYTPSVKFRMAHTHNHILIHYQVEEQSVRAMAPADNGHVWEDSCCEFFVSPDDDGTYYNIEANCAGKVLLANGPDRHARTYAEANSVAQIARWSSLGSEPFDEKVGNCAWQMTLVIPTTVFFKHQDVQLAGKKMKANFYKCGDLLQVPHFLSWNKISVERPDFHRPDFFGNIEFE